MLTLIFDIDGTLTDMWPIERAVLYALIPESKWASLDALRREGIKDLFTLYSKSMNIKLGKLVFRDLYRNKFNELKKMEALPLIQEYECVNFIRQNPKRYIYVYATGGLKSETEYVLEQLGIKEWFSLSQSTSKDTYRYSKATGLPFARIKRQLGECCLITDSTMDVMGSGKAGIRGILINSDTPLSIDLIQS